VEGWIGGYNESRGVRITCWALDNRPRPLNQSLGTGGSGMEACWHAEDQRSGF
jgi:hypothetical protein